ncbi:hypothetical protein IBE10_09185 [Francisella tularensis subsp. novicida]|uniref:hypothetical protein n=1 Tax=Francisella tularensis TaxID=263 RepID=UPI000A5E3B51|nr:hypothetical protein [Francisella tularensis]MBK2347087.1 hypothetical protein [Francisella tularensis subsp. novicida]
MKINIKKLMSILFLITSVTSISFAGTNYACEFLVDGSILEGERFHDMEFESERIVGYVRGTNRITCFKAFETIQDERLVFIADIKTIFYIRNNDLIDNTETYSLILEGRINQDDNEGVAELFHERVQLAKNAYYSN